MRIIKGDLNERRLASLMLCMEHGAYVYGPELNELPAPHEPCFTIKLPQKTRAGVPVTATYKPSVGVVYYTLTEGYNIGPVVRRVGRLLKPFAAHLGGLRPTATTPSTVLRTRSPVNGTVTLAKARKCFTKLIGAQSLPARLVMYTPIDSCRELPPPYYSIRAAFTWVFMPIVTAFSQRNVYTEMNWVNSRVASILYDVGGLCLLEEGRDHYDLSIEDFALPVVPEFLTDGVRRLESLVDDERREYEGTAVIIYTAGAKSLTYMGDYQILLIEPKHKRPFKQSLKETVWEPDKVASIGPDMFQCCSCRAVLGGDVILIHDPRAPPMHHADHHGLPVGTPLLRRGTSVPMCTYCWGRIETDCLTVHMGARLTWTSMPITQGQACASVPKLQALSEMLLGTVTPVPGVSGAFMVQMRKDGPCNGATVILTGKTLGPHPGLRLPSLGSLRLPIISELTLATLA